MAGNITLTDDSGTVLASDEVDGVQVLRVKPQFGDPGAASDVSTGNPLPVDVRAPGLVAFRAVGLVAIPQVAKDSAARLFGWHLANTGSSGAFVKVFDAASAPTVGTDAPTMTLFAPAGGVVAAELPNGISFTNGIALAATTDATDASTTAPPSGTITVDLFYVGADVTDESGGGADPSTIGVVTPSANTIAKRDGAGKVFGVGLDAGSARVTNVATPTAGTDAATKAYVDAGDAASVPGARTLTATAPLTIDGGSSADLSANRTLAISNATSSASGAMSASDKTKLDGITAGAAVASVSGTAPIVSSGGTTPAISINVATDSTAGSMSAADKTKLDAATASPTPSTLALRGSDGSLSGELVNVTTPVSTPSAPSTGYRIYVDTGDGVLKAMDSSANVMPLGPGIIRWGGWLHYTDLNALGAVSSGYLFITSSGISSTGEATPSTWYFSGGDVRMVGGWSAAFTSSGGAFTLTAEIGTYSRADYVLQNINLGSAAPGFPVAYQAGTNNRAYANGNPIMIFFTMTGGTFDQLTAGKVWVEVFFSTALPLAPTGP